MISCEIVFELFFCQCSVKESILILLFRELLLLDSSTVHWYNHEYSESVILVSSTLLEMIRSRLNRMIFRNILC